MKFNPPHIESINDVLPHIKDNPAFIVKQKGWYTVIDYMYMSDKMFHNDVERECRGLKFCSTTGRILARPYHKFHNLNERPDYTTDKVDLTLPHVILDKLDGSMVHTCATTMGIYLMTRMGVTEVAEQADKFLLKNQIRFSRLFGSLPIDEYCYIFEYVGPNNKIVLDYEKEDLILTGIRNIYNGAYVYYHEMAALAAPFGVKVVERFPFEGFEGNMERIANCMKDQRHNEGYVVRFASGAMIKIKSDEYVRKHRTKDLVSSQKGILDLIVNNNLDDVLPQLDPPVRTKVEEYQSAINEQISLTAACAKLFVASREDLTQKDFALEVQDQVAKPLQSVYFLIRRGCDPHEETLNLIRKNVGTNKRASEILTGLEFPLWTFSFFAEE